VYERVLDWHPATGLLSPGSRVAAPTATRHSAIRKQSGTFYTPQPLAEFVVRRTLAPLVAGASAHEIARLRVLDLAMGSGAFLVAACRFLADAYGRALLSEGGIAPEDFDAERRADIRRLIAERCLAGVDLNGTAVQLARLSLWLITLAHGRPLGFLDHALRVGNSLVGASPDDLRRTDGLRRPRPAALPLFDDEALASSLRLTAEPLHRLRLTRDDSVADVRAKETLWSGLTGSNSPLEHWRMAAHLWCARWFLPGATRPIGAPELRALIDTLLRDDRTLSRPDVELRLQQARDIAAREHFFHWTLEFPDVFFDDAGVPKARPGFDAVIGNPPWEVLRNDDPPGAPDDGDQRRSGSLLRFIRESGIYRACDRGHLNLYQPFLERAQALVRPGGRVGLVMPWSFASDDGSARLRRSLLEEESVDTLIGIDNARGLFPIHRGLRFVVLVTGAGRPGRQVDARFGISEAAALEALPGRRDPLAPDGLPRITASALLQVGGAQARIPDLRHPGDLAFLQQLTAAFPPIGAAEGWQARFGRELNATDDRPAFGAVGLPVIEGKHLAPFHVDTTRAAWCVSHENACRLLRDRRFERPRLGYRDVSGAGNRLTLIAAIVPANVVTTHTIFCLRAPIDDERAQLLCALFNSYVLNAVVRMLMGGHVTTSLVEQLPVPVWTGDSDQRRLAALARRLQSGAAVPEEAAELQALAATLFGVGPDAFEMLLERFPLVPVEERRLAAAARRAGARRRSIGR
jgi:hypothetical protein